MTIETARPIWGVKKFSDRNLSGLFTQASNWFDELEKETHNIYKVQEIKVDPPIDDEYIWTMIVSITSKVSYGDRWNMTTRRPMTKEEIDSAEMS